MISILDFGAATDKSARENRAAIQSAIDAANAKGGDTVCVPAGTFISANIELKSNVTLKLEPGAVLKASSDFRDYDYTHEPSPYAPMHALPAGGAEANKQGLAAGTERVYRLGFIWAENAVNVSVVGPGTVDGQGDRHRFFPAKDDPKRRRPMLLLFIGCSFVRVTDVVMLDAAVYSLYCVKCRKVWVRGVYLYSWHTENGDGLDFEGTSEVVISDCNVEAGDDGISLKTLEPGWSCTDYTITNCRLSSVWAGVRLGTESTADMRDIVISNCIFTRCNDAVKIQDCSLGVYENIRISDCIMRNVHRPVFMTTNSYRLSLYDDSLRPTLGGIREVVLENITAYMSEPGTGYERNSFVISGAACSPIENVTLRNIRLFVTGGGTAEDADRVDVPEYLDYTFLYADVFSINGNFPAAGPYLRNIRGLCVEGCRLTCTETDARPMFFCDNVLGVLSNVRVEGKYAGALVAMDSQLAVKGCNFEAGSLTGERIDKFRRAKEITRDTDALFDEWVKTVDEAEKLSICAVAEPETDGGVSRAEVDAPGAKLLWLELYGDCEVFINGEKVGEVRLDPMYRNVVKWACRVPGGRMSLELRWDAPADVGGPDCLLPFGVFKPFSVGLQKPAVFLG